MIFLALPFIAAGAVLTGGAAKGAVHAVERCTAEQEDVPGGPLRKATSRPLWATSTQNLDPEALAKVFGHGPSTADQEVRKAEVLAAAA